MNEETSGKIFFAIGLFIFIVVILVVALAKPSFTAYAVHNKNVENKGAIESYTEIVKSEIGKKAEEVGEKINDTVIYKDLSDMFN